MTTCGSTFRRTRRRGVGGLEGSISTCGVLLFLPLLRLLLLAVARLSSSGAASAAKALAGAGGVGSRDVAALRAFPRLFFERVPERGIFFPPHGGHQIPIAASEQEKTAFVTQNGKWVFKRLPFGIANAPFLFSRIMSLAFAHFGPKSGLLVYMDDCICCSSTWTGHLNC